MSSRPRQPGQASWRGRRTGAVLRPRRERYRAWLAKYVYGVKGFGEYLDLCGGLSRMQELRRQELLLNQEG